MIQRRNLRTRNIKMFILDEADEMLNKGFSINGSSFLQTKVIVCHLVFYYTGFKEQIYDVYRHLPPATQVCSSLTSLQFDFYTYTMWYLIGHSHKCHITP